MAQLSEIFAWTHLKKKWLSCRKLSLENRCNITGKGTHTFSSGMHPWSHIAPWKYSVHLTETVNWTTSNIYNLRLHTLFSGPQDPDHPITKFTATWANFRPASTISRPLPELTSKLALVAPLGSRWLTFRRTVSLVVISLTFTSIWKKT